MANVSVGKNLGIWLVAIVAALALLAACGGSGDNEDAPTATPEGSNGGLQSQNPSQNANACEAFSILGGLGSFGGQMADGPSFETSGSPPSSFAADVSSFAEDALEDVLDGDVSADCYFSVDEEGTGGVWIALVLPGSPPSGTAQSLGDTMEGLGATIGGVITSSSTGGSFDVVALDAFPFDAPNGNTPEGGIYFVTSEDGFYQAVVVASYDTASGSDDQSPSNGGSTAPTPTPTTAAAPTPVTPTGIAGTINDDLQPMLEAALGIELIVDSFFQTSSGGANTASLSYVPDGSLPDANAVQNAFTAVVDEHGGTVGFTMASSGVVTVSFEEVQAGDLSVAGNLSLNQTGKIHLVVTNAQ